MAQMRWTYMFASDRGYGWSETYFTNLPNHDTTLAAARAVLPARVNLLAGQSRCVFIRVSDDAIKRDSKVFPVPAGDQRSKMRYTGGDDIANTCLVCRIESGVLKRRTLFLRGIPDDIVVNGGEYQPVPAFTGSLITFTDALKNAQVGVRSRGDFAAPVNIVNVGTVGPTGLVTITTQAAHGFALNDVVNIRGLKGAGQVRGLQQVVAVGSATTFDIRVSRVVSPYLSNGNVCRIVYSLPAIDNLVAVRISHHNAGRPFDSPRGRRRVR